MNRESNLASVSKRLATVTSLRFRSTSQTNNIGWSGEGRGQVVVEAINADAILFHEQGLWQQDGGKQLAFTNVFRWTVLSEANVLRLEHLRFGSERPVYLFDLRQADPTTWQSIEPHLCRDDCYSAEMKLSANELSLRWTIEGPEKNESIHYWYQ